MIFGKLPALLLVLGIVFFPPAKALAVSTPEFPLCVNPTGDLKVSYDSGTHGIVGDTNTYTGSDKVYTVNQNQLIQCFCAQDGTGIQTNWLKVGQLSGSDRKVYEDDGFIYVPNGSLWGLEDTGYVAKNSTYSCKGSGNGLSQGSSGSTQSTGGTGGSLQGTNTVLGLASTGDITTTLSFFFAGVTALLLGLTLSKRSE